MQLIANATINIVQTRPPHQQYSDWIYHYIGKNNIQVIGGVGQVCTKVDCTFELVA